MKSQFVGGVLLIVGTSIGAGMLALPVATAHAGAIPSYWTLLACWALMTFGAFLILEVNLWLPDNSNLISMAKQTLGVPGQILAWLVYLLLLYSLMSAYIAGGSDVLDGFARHLPFHVPIAISTIVFAIVFGAIVTRGIRTVDMTNRSFMSVKFIALFLLIVLLLPLIKKVNLAEAHPKYILSTVVVIITSFGYATIIPSLRTYFKGNVKILRLVILVGSLIPLISYFLWETVVLGSVPHHGAHGLLAMANSAQPVSELSATIAYQSHLKSTDLFVHLFTSICVVTSFLGVSLCLVDFLSDGLKLPKKGWDGVKVFALAFVPPLVIVLFDPKIFVMGLRYAGVFCLLLLVLLPALMAWRGRYLQCVSGEYRVLGGKVLLATAIAASLFAIVVAFITA